MALLLQVPADTAADSEILNYKHAIDFYSDQLDRIWK